MLFSATSDLARRSSPGTLADILKGKSVETAKDVGQDPPDSASGKKVCLELNIGFMNVLSVFYFIIHI